MQLRRKIRAKYDSIKEFAGAIGVSQTTTSSWMNGKPIPYGAVLRMCEVLEIKREEIGDIFYPMIEGRSNE